MTLEEELKQCKSHRTACLRSIERLEGELKDTQTACEFEIKQLENKLEPIIGSFEWALSQMKDGKLVKRGVVKNDTAISEYKNKLVQMNTSNMVRFPYVPTNADHFANDWVLVILEHGHNK